MHPVHHLGTFSGPGVDPEVLSGCLGAMSGAARHLFDEFCEFPRGPKFSPGRIYIDKNCGVLTNYICIEKSIVGNKLVLERSSKAANGPLA